MSRPVPSVPSRRAVRRRRLAALSGVCVACLAGVPSASATAVAKAAAPSPATPVAPADLGPVSAEHRITKLTASIDRGTGAWTTTVTFGAPQQPATAAALGVLVQIAGQNQPAASWSARTDPDALVLRYANPFVVPTPTAPGPIPTATFNAERTVLTAQVTDPVLVGRTVNSVGAVLANPDVPDDGSAPDIGIYSAKTVFFGSPVPQVRIPAAARRLVVDRDGTLRIPLSPLSARANRTVLVELPHHHLIGGRSLPSSDYRRSSVSQRLSAEALRHLSRTPRSASLVIRTSLPNGNTRQTAAKVSIRRR